MKNARVFTILLLFAVWSSLTACSLKSSQYPSKNGSQNSVNDVSIQKIDETDELSERLEQYKFFLQDKISSETKSDGALYLRDFCNVVVPEETKDGIRYALFDMTGDGLPELHVLTDISYSIHTIENNQLITWYEGDRYRRPLNNRAILEEVHNYHGYIILDNKGEKVFSCAFVKGGTKDTNLFTTGGDYIELSESDWDKLIKPFLAIGSDKIIWKNIDNLTFDEVPQSSDNEKAEEN